MVFREKFQDKKRLGYFRHQAKLLNQLKCQNNGSADN